MMHVFQWSKLSAFVGFLFLGLYFVLPVQAAEEQPHPNVVSLPPAAPMGAAYGCNPTNGRNSAGFSPGSYITTVAGHRSAIVVGNGYSHSQPTYLAVVLHGQHTNWRDFARNSNNPVTKLVKEQGWILVAPKAPDGTAWKLDSNGAHRQKLKEVLDRMFSSFNLCRNYYMVAADGSAGQFWVSDFFPREGGTFPAHAFIACGGDNLSSTERNLLNQINNDASVMDRALFYYTVGRNDNNASTYQAGFKDYRDYNFSVRVDWLSGVGNCNQWPMSVEQQIVDKWQFFGSRFPAASGAGSGDSGSTSPTPTPIAPTPTPVPDSSGDTGGSYTAGACNPTNGSGGFKPGLYKTTVAGLKAGVIVGDGYHPSKPTYLAFFLHGDGAQWQSYVENKNNPVTKLVRERGWIMIVPESPNGKWWWKNWSGDHNKKLAAAFDEMFRKYNVCRNSMLGASGSGGSQFFTRQFFPTKGKQYPVHMLIACGGDGVTSSGLRYLKDIGKNSDLRSRSLFYYLYGSKDYLVPYIENSIGDYRAANLRVQVQKISGAGHCNQWPKEGYPDLKTQIAAKWKIFVRNFPAAAGASDVDQVIPEPYPFEGTPPAENPPILPPQTDHMIYLPSIGK